MIVTSSAQWKIDRAVELGASRGVLYTDPEWPAAGGRDRPGGGQRRRPRLGRHLPTACGWAARCVSFGDTGGEPRLSISNLFFGQWNILGTTMGSPREFDALLAHVDRAGWRPVVDTSFPLAEAAAAHARLDSPERFGKVVLRVR